MTSAKLAKRVERAVIAYCSKRYFHFGDGTEQWHDWRFATPDEKALFVAYRALAAHDRKGKR